MRKFILKLLLQVSPIFSIVIGSIFVNPYNYPYFINFNYLSTLKSQKILNLDTRMSVAVSSLNMNSPTVLIGDSRTKQLFDNTTRNNLPQYLNLGFGGAKFNEIVELSWFVIENNNELKNLYIGLNLNHYSIDSKSIRMSEAIRAVSSSVSFLLSKQNIIGSFDVLIAPKKSKLNGLEYNELLTRKLFETKDDFWQYQIDHSARQFYENMIPNEMFKSELDSLISVCQEKDVNIGFFSPPTHTDLQSQVKRWGLLNLKSSFEQILTDLPVTYVNLDVNNEFTNDSANFKDPFHLEKGQEHILAEIFEKLSYQTQ